MGPPTIRYHAAMRWYGTLIAGLAMAVASSSHVAAQEKYTLNEGDNWELTDSPEPGTPGGQLAAARRALAEGNPREAVRLASIWLERFERNPLVPEAYMTRADALFQQKEYYESLFDYELVAREYHDSNVFSAALERELDIATLFANGTLRKKWGMRIFSAKDEAEELLIRIQERVPGSALAETAGMELADFYFRERRMLLATDAYALFLVNYPRSDQIRKARRRLIYSRLATYRGPAFDGSGLDDSRMELQQLALTDPVEAQRMGADAIITRIDESEARKLLSVAEWYLDTGDPIAAEYEIRRLVKRYPQTAACIIALERVVPRFVPLLPAAIREVAPDYAALQEAILGRVVGLGESE